MNLDIYKFTIEDEQKDKTVIQSLINRAKSNSAKQAICTADELADLIIFHARVRENLESDKTERESIIMAMDHEYTEAELKEFDMVVNQGE